MNEIVRRMSVVRKEKSSGLSSGVVGRVGEIRSGQRTEENQELMQVFQFCAPPPFLQVEDMSY